MCGIETATFELCLSGYWIAQLIALICRYRGGWFDAGVNQTFFIAIFRFMWKSKHVTCIVKNILVLACPTSYEITHYIFKQNTICY